MKHYLLIWALVLAGSLPMRNIAQTVLNLEQLENRVEQASGTARVDLLNQLAYEYYGRSPQKSLDYAQQAMAEAKASDYAKGEAAALFNASWAQTSLGDHRLALKSAHASLAIREAIGDEQGVADSLNNVGSLYRTLSEFEPALKYSLKSLEAKEKLGDKRGIAGTLGNIGLLYDGLENFPQALEYHQRSLRLAEEIDNLPIIGNELNALGIIYEKLKQYDDALSHYERSLAVKEKIGDRVGVGRSLGNIGGIYQLRGDYRRSLEYRNRALALAKELKDQLGIATNLNNIGHCFLKMGNIDQAERHLQESLELAEKIDSDYIAMEAHKQLSETYKASNRFARGLDHFEKYFALFRETFNETNAKQIAELQERFEAHKKEQQIALLSKEKQLLATTGELAELTRNALIIGVILLVAILALLFKRYLFLFAFWKKEKTIAQYRLLEKIGTGGTSNVYRARSLADKNTTVAIKVMREDLNNAELTEKRFRHEASIIDRLVHPHIVRVIERGEHKRRLFIAMEWVGGKTLRSRLNEVNRLPLVTAVQATAQIADALVLIHSKRIFHRDLKPENIMIVEDGAQGLTVKLLDFGIAKTTYHTTLTQADKIVGTARYMSPEQTLNKKVDTATDIYSLGAVFYEMLTGEAVVTGVDWVTIQRQILNNRIRPINELRSDTPAELNDLVMAMLSRYPAQRPSTTMIRDQLVAYEPKGADTGESTASHRDPTDAPTEPDRTADPALG